MPAKSIEQVFDEQESKLMSIPGVVGVGIGDCEGSPCIRVLVRKLTRLLNSSIPSSLDKYHVEVQETGEIRALDRP